MARNPFSDESYDHYDPRTEGYGSAEQWSRIADAIAYKIGGQKGFRGSVRPHIVSPTKNPDLEVMLLDQLPDTVNGLKTAFKNCLFLVHPDVGGSSEDCRILIEAYERLLKLPEGTNYDKMISKSGFNVWITWPQLALQHTTASDNTGKTINFEQVYKTKIKEWKNE